MKIYLKKIKTIIILIIPFILFSCTTTLTIKGIPGKEEFISSPHFRPVWENVSKGIDMMIFHQSNPNFTISAIRVDLSARSLIGTVNAGNIVFLVAIDGENTPNGSGATFFESAEWMKAIGATNAINMDGGGSSVLALRTNLKDKIEVLNHPNGGILTFFQRNVPVFIGIR